MEMIQNSVVDGKQAKLFLLSDNQTLKIALENKIIETIHGAWKNIKNDNWAQLAILLMEVKDYLEKKEAEKELKSLADEYF